jgi:hypothetical protein
MKYNHIWYGWEGLDCHLPLHFTPLHFAQALQLPAANIAWDMIHHPRPVHPIFTRGYFIAYSLLGAEGIRIQRLGMEFDQLQIRYTIYGQIWKFIKHVDHSKVYVSFVRFEIDQ